MIRSAAPLQSGAVLVPPMPPMLPMSSVVVTAWSDGRHPEAASWERRYACAPPNNPVLARPVEAQCPPVRDPAVASLIARGAALCAGASGAAGCGCQGSAEIALIALGWGIVTVAALAGIFLGLDGLAGWVTQGSATPGGIAKLIDKGDVLRIERILADEERTPAEISHIQSRVLPLINRLPVLKRLRVYQAVFRADGEQGYVLAAINGLLNVPLPRDYIIGAVIDLMGAVERKPDDYRGMLVAKALIAFEFAHKGSISDNEFVHAIAVTGDWKDVLIMIGLLSTRIKLRHTRTTAHLWKALGHLVQKPYGRSLLEDFLPPYLVDIDGFEVELPPSA